MNAGLKYSAQVRIKTFLQLNKYREQKQRQCQECTHHKAASLLQCVSAFFVKEYGIFRYAYFDF